MLILLITAAIEIHKIKQVTKSIKKMMNYLFSFTMKMSIL
jgi:hypothetical protein